MTVAVNLRRIEDTLANGITNLTDGKIMLLSNTNKEIMGRVDANFYMFRAGCYTTDGVSFTYIDQDFANVNVRGDTLAIAQDLQHYGDTDTYFRFTPDALNATIGGVNILDAVPTAVEFNSANADVDFIVNTVAADTLHIDGATGNVGIGKVPDQLFCLHATAPVPSLIEWAVSSKNYGYAGAAGTTDSIISGAVLGDICIRSIATNDILFSADDGASCAVRISHTAGAVTIAGALDLGGKLTVDHIEEHTSLNGVICDDYFKGAHLCATDLAANVGKLVCIGASLGLLVNTSITDYTTYVQSTVDFKLYSGTVNLTLGADGHLTAAGLIRADNSDVAVMTNGKGLVLLDSGGHYWRVGITTGGVLTTTDLGTSYP